MFSKKPLNKTKETLWPSSTSHHVKIWVGKFFQLLDGYSSDAAQQWAELYTADGTFEVFGQTFRGAADIKGHLLRFWAMFPGPTHTPKSVYISRGTHSGSEMDIITVTTYAVAFPDGQFVTGESMAVLNVVKNGNRMAVRSNRLFLDPNPLMQALGTQSPAGERKDIASTHHENAAEQLPSAAASPR